ILPAVSGCENQSVKVDGTPTFFPCGTHSPALFVVSRFHEYGLPGVDAGGKQRPKPVTDTSPGIADEHSGVDFDHPAGQVPAQPFGCGDENDDGHVSGVSNSGPRTVRCSASIVGVMSSSGVSSSRCPDQSVPPGTVPR